MSVRGDTLGGRGFSGLEIRFADAEEALAAHAESSQSLIPWPTAPGGLIAFWMSSPWLAAVGGLLADSVSGASFELRAREVDLNGRLIDKSKLTKDDQDEDYGRGMAWLLRETFALEGVSELSLQGFLRSTALMYDQTGNVFCEVLRDRAGTKFSALSVLLPQFVTYQARKGGQNDDWGAPARHSAKPFELLQVDPYFGEAVFVPFGERDDNRREFLHQRATNSLSSFYGLPAWLTARDSVGVDNAHRKYLKDFFSNNASPRWMIKITQNPDWQGLEPDESEIDALYTRVKSFLDANVGEMAGRNLVIQFPGGLKVEAEALDTKVEDPTFGATAKGARDEILAVRHVSLIDLGLPEGGYRATAETQAKGFQRQVLEPFAAPLEALINRVLHAPEPFGLGVTTYDFALKFERIEDVLAQFETLVKATGVPFLAPNEGRQLAGFEAKQGGDTLYIPSNMIPALEPMGAGPDGV